MEEKDFSDLFDKATWERIKAIAVEYDLPISQTIAALAIAGKEAKEAKDAENRRIRSGDTQIDVGFFEATA